MSSRSSRSPHRQIRASWRSRLSKYKAQPTTLEVDGDTIRFASKGEARRFCTLRLLERAGEIRNLRRQIAFPLVVNGHLISRYIADFAYVEAGAEVVEDFKGYETDEFKLKRKLLKALYGIDLRITKA